jgi:hypothetical protein
MVSAKTAGESKGSAMLKKESPECFAHIANARQDCLALPYAASNEDKAE